MLIQETINEPDTLLRLLVSLDDQLQALQPQLAAQQLPRDGRGGTPRLCAAAVLTLMIYGAWLGLSAKAKLYYYFQRHHWAEFPALPSYSKFVEATNRVVREADNSATTVDGPDVYGSFTSQGYNLIGKHDGSSGFVNGVNHDQVGSIASPLDPLLGPLAHNGGPTQTHCLAPQQPGPQRGQQRTGG